MKASLMPTSDHCPWGRIDSRLTLAPGIVSVATEGHGGIWLSPERALMLPSWARITPPNFCPKPTWWEEDVEAAIVILAFYDEMPERIRARHTRLELLHMFSRSETYSKVWAGARAAMVREMLA